MVFIDHRQAEEAYQKWRKEHPEEAAASDKQWREMRKDPAKLIEFLKGKGFDFPQLGNAVFRHRIYNRHRLTNRVFCLKDQRERGSNNVSFDRCKDGCKDALRIEDKGVWCSFGQSKTKDASA